MMEPMKATPERSAEGNPLFTAFCKTEQERLLAQAAVMRFEEDDVLFGEDSLADRA